MTDKEFERLWRQAKEADRLQIEALIHRWNAKSIDEKEKYVQDDVYSSRRYGGIYFEELGKPSEYLPGQYEMLVEMRDIAKRLGLIK